MNPTAIADSFHEEVSKLLASMPRESEAFLALWQAKDYRPAYLYVLELVHSGRVSMTPAFERVDRDFYWVFIA